MHLHMKYEIRNMPYVMHDNIKKLNLFDYY